MFSSEPIELLFSVVLLVFFIISFYDSNLSPLNNIRKLSTVDKTILLNPNFILIAGFIIFLNLTYGAIGLLVSTLLLLFFRKVIWHKDSVLDGWSYTYIFIFSLYLTTTYLVTPVKPISDSMEGTISIGEYNPSILCAYGLRSKTDDNYLLTWSTPKKGDIVTIEIPSNTTNKYFNYMIEENGKDFTSNVRLCKRIVATSGDSFFMKNGRLYLHPKEGNKYILREFKGYEIVEKEGKLFIKDPYIKDNPKIQFIKNKEYKEFKKELPQVYDTNITTLGENQYFVMGDNRNLSFDARLFGAIPINLITGKVVLTTKIMEKF